MGMVRLPIAAALLLSHAAPLAAQDIQEPQIRQNRERLEREREDAQRREELAPRQGERIRRDQTNPSTTPMARINNRIANRLDTRLRTRQERTTDDGRDRIGLSGDLLNEPNRARRQGR